MDNKSNTANIKIRTANERIQAGLLLPELKCLLGDIWLTGELAILFGGTGSGKSIFAVQVADKLSKGESVDNEHLINECQAKVVLFFDFELSDKQFQVRYTSDVSPTQTYSFDDNLKFVNIPFGQIYDPSKKMTDTVFEIINGAIEQTKAEVLIIDNISALSSQDSQDGNTAMELMAHLDKLKREKSISILVIAHSPKKFNYTPITISDVAGSAKIVNFSDCVFAIGKSIMSNDHRYLIQVKYSRNKKEAFDYNNVLTLIKTKTNTYLKYQTDGTTIEKEHLYADGDDLKLQAKSLHAQGLSYREIEKQLKVSKSTVANWLKNNK